MLANEDRYWLPPVPETPCVLWSMCCDKKGYGRRTVAGVAGYAHRFAWIERHGPIPDGLTIDHLCRVKACVNVDHMELVTRGENTRRALALRHLLAGAGWCKKHDLAMDRETPKGRRYCSICMTESNARKVA